MKKIFIVLAIVVVIVLMVGIRYVSYKNNQDMIKKENAEFEIYTSQESVYGIDVATVINKAIDKNTKNEIEKNDKSIFIQNDENSIEVEIYMQDNETTYKMENIYNSGTEQFVQYYGNAKFKCSKIEYHKKTGRIKYILFEQEENS